MKQLLPEVCTIQYGFPFDSAKFSDSDGMPLIRIRDVMRGYSETYTTEEYKSEYIVHENDLLIGMDGEFNIAKWGKTPALLNQRVCRLAPKDNIDKGYLFYFMPVALKRIEEKTPFVTVKHLSAKELNKIEIPILSLEEQRKIAETLSKVDELIAFRDQQLTKLDELVKARFVEMFGDPICNSKRWDKVVLKDVCHKITDGEHGSVPRVLQGHPFLNAKHIKKDGSIDWMTVSFVADEVHDKIYKRCNPETDDILITTTGSIGNIAIVPKTCPFSMDRGITLLKINHEKINARYISTLLRFNGLQSIMQANIHASAIGHLFLNQVECLPIILPPLALQNRFAAFVERVNQQKQTVQQSLEKLELMKKALMQEYFG